MLLKSSRPPLDGALRDRLVFQAGVTAGRRQRRATGWIVSTCALGLLTIALSVSNWMARQPVAGESIVTGNDAAKDRVDLANEDEESIVKRHESVSPNWQREGRILRAIDRWTSAMNEGRATDDDASSHPGSLTPDAQPPRPILTPVSRLHDLDEFNGI